MAKLERELADADRLVAKIFDSPRDAALALKLLGFMISGQLGVLVSAPGSGLGPDHEVEISLGNVPRAFIAALQRVANELEETS